jgi:hypothetical protein
MTASERRLRRYQAMTAVRTFGVTPRAVTNARAPFVAWVPLAAPPTEPRGRGNDGIGVAFPVLGRVPFGGHPREARRKAIGDGHFSVRAKRAPCPAGAVVRVRSPQVVTALLALPPDTTPGAGPHDFGGQDPIAIPIPFLDESWIPRYPVARSGKTRPVSHCLPNAPPHAAAGSKQPACLEAHGGGAKRTVSLSDRVPAPARCTQQPFPCPFHILRSRNVAGGRADES